MEAKNNVDYLGLAAEICHKKQKDFKTWEADELPLSKRVELIERALVDLAAQFAPIHAAIQHLNNKIG